MRLTVLAVALLALAGCVQPMPPPDKSAANKSDLTRFVAPVDGAAYSQGDVRYYGNYANPYPTGASAPEHTK